MEKISKGGLYDNFYDNIDRYNKADTWSLLNLLPVSSCVISEVINIPAKASMHQLVDFSKPMATRYHLKIVKDILEDKQSGLEFASQLIES